MLVLKQGSTGAEVKKLQERLNQLGFNCGAVDGIFGKKTYNAVISFQRSRGLVMDGIVGPKTKALLWTPAFSGKWTKIVNHHTGAEEKNAAQVRQYHLSLGWRDVGYNYLIERDGRLVIGRSLEIKGAHCVELNHCAIGVCMIGNMNNHPPTPEQYATWLDLLPTLSKRFGISTKDILGHREASPTACPGTHVDMNKVRADVDRKLNPPKQKPAPAPASSSIHLPKITKGIGVRVNGKPVSIEGFLINGTTYLQGLFVAGLFGGSVTGHGDYIDIKTK